MSASISVSGTPQYYISDDGNAWNPRGGEGGEGGETDSEEGSSIENGEGPGESDIDGGGSGSSPGDDTQDNSGISVELEPLDESRSICTEHKDEGVVYAYYRERLETQVAKLRMSFDLTDVSGDPVIGIETSGPFEIVIQGQPEGVNVTPSGNIFVNEYDNSEFDVLVNLESYSSYDPSQEYELTVNDYENGSGAIGSTQISSP